ncbi:putative P-type ATPase, cytoplasmic domain N [Helianthus anomalus]
MVSLLLETNHLLLSLLIIRLTTSFTLSCHTVAFDKTRTLSTGEFMCKAIEPIHGHEATASCCVTTCEKEALAVVAAMEKGTTHPIGRVICDLQSSNGIHPSLTRDEESQIAYLT